MSVKFGINGFGRMGRLLGTLLSGVAYQIGGIIGCLLTAAGLLLLARMSTVALGPAAKAEPAQAAAE